MRTTGKTFAVLLILLSLMPLTLLPSCTVKAQSKTLVVPDDYPTVTSAIGNASNGDKILIKTGIYEGPINQTLLINKSISIVGEDAANTKIVFYPVYRTSWICSTEYFTLTDCMTVTAHDFLLSNITITSVFGGNISITGDRAKILGNSIHTFSVTDTGLSVNGNECQVIGNILSSSTFLAGDSNAVLNNTCDSMYLSAANRNEIKLNRIKFLAIGLSNQSICTFNNITQNRIVSTTRGLQVVLLGCATNNLFSKNQIEGGGYGVAQLGAFPGSNGHLIPSENNTFSLNNFINNDLGNHAIDNATNYWDNGAVGNYWSDYYGEGSYVINRNNIDHYPLTQPIEVSSITTPAPTSPMQTINTGSDMPEAELFLTALVAVSIVIIGIGLLGYCRKRQRSKSL